MFKVDFGFRIRTIDEYLGIESQAKDDIVMDKDKAVEIVINLHQALQHVSEDVELSDELNLEVTQALKQAEPLMAMAKLMGFL